MSELKRIRMIERYDRKFRREQRKAEKLLRRFEKVRDMMSVIISIQTSLARKDF